LKVPGIGRGAAGDQGAEGRGCRTPAGCGSARPCRPAPARSWVACGGDLRARRGSRATRGRRFPFGSRAPRGPGREWRGAVAGRGFRQPGASRQVRAGRCGDRRPGKADGGRGGSPRVTLPLGGSQGPALLRPSPACVSSSWRACDSAPWLGTAGLPHYPQAWPGLA
jgi:hypothetical protein